MSWHDREGIATKVHMYIQRQYVWAFEFRRHGQEGKYIYIYILYVIYTQCTSSKPTYNCAKLDQLKPFTSLKAEEGLCGAWAGMCVLEPGKKKGTKKGSVNVYNLTRHV